MTRIIAGRAGGRTLLTPRGESTRPTSDRVREAIFSRTLAMTALEGAVVVDLYAGSGALGLEAASRGARAVRCVESDRSAARLIERNTLALGLPAVRVTPARVERWLVAPCEDEAFDVAFADPPYRLGESELAAVLAGVAARLAPDAVVMVERSVRSPEPTWPSQWAPAGSRRYGQTAVHAARVGGPGAAKPSTTSPDAGWLTR